MTTKPVTEETQLNMEDDVVFARGGFRPTLRTEQFYTFLRKLLPLYEKSDRWGKHSLVKCIVESYTQGRFLKKKGSSRYFLLPVSKVEQQIVLTFRAFKTTSRASATHNNDPKFHSFIYPVAIAIQRSKSNSTDDKQDASTKESPPPTSPRDEFKQDKTITASVYEKTIRSLSRFEQEHFASQLYKYQIFVDRKNSDANDR